MEATTIPTLFLDMVRYPSNEIACDLRRAKELGDDVFSLVK